MTKTYTSDISLIKPDGNELVSQSRADFNTNFNTIDDYLGALVDGFELAKQHGAIGNGSADDSVAIQEALDVYE